MSDGLVMTETLRYERLKSVTVSWSYPRLLDNMWSDERLDNFGLYYISRKFGSKETLLYIGQTYDSYYNRFIDHDFSWLGDYRGKIYIRLGTITHPSNRTNAEMKQIVKDVESAMIYEMRDTLRNNVMGIKSYTPKHLYVITNTGYRGELDSMISMGDHHNNK